MPPPLLFSLDGIDLDTITAPIEAIRKVNPQRYEMEQLTGIIHADAEARRLVAERRIAEDEWWMRGHIPGRPLLPGVLMIEAAAQACAYLYKVMDPAEDRFIGFGGVQDVKFRGQVVGGDRMIILVETRAKRSRKAIFGAQGLVDAQMVFEAEIVGMPL